MFKEAEITNSFHNINNRPNIVLLHNKINELKGQNFEYLANIIYEFMLNSQEIYKNEEKCDEIKRNIDTVYYDNKVVNRKEK